MAMKTTYTGVYITIGVEQPYGKVLDSKDLYATARDLVAQIERHCDGVDYSEINFQTERVCEFCGSNWTEGNNEVYNGGCCAGDEKTVLENVG